MEPAPKKRRNKRTVPVRLGLARFRVAKKYSQEELKQLTGLSTDTIQQIEKGEPVSPKKLMLYANALDLQWEDVADIEAPEHKTPPAAENEVGPWLMLSRPGPWMTSANGLQWTLYELRHKFIPDRRARGKLYDLKQHLALQTVGDIQHWLTRHAEVADRVKDLSKHVGKNFDSFPDPSRPKHWWVIDEWIDGRSLEDVLREGPMKEDRALRIMMEVAGVLHLLHGEDLVYRTLSPRSIFLTDAGAVVTDFELTKILGGGLTVAPQGQYPDWGVYVAPEVSGRKKIQPTADLYSWAMILANLLSGKKFNGPDPATEIIETSRLPQDVAEFAAACLGPNRPASFKELLALGKRNGKGARRGP